MPNKPCASSLTLKNLQLTAEKISAGLSIFQMPILKRSSGNLTSADLFLKTDHKSVKSVNRLLFYR